MPRLVTKERVALLISSFQPITMWEIDKFRPKTTEILLQLEMADVLELYATTLREAAREPRKRVLATLKLFAPSLIAFMGPAMVSAADEALRIGCRSMWP